MASFPTRSVFRRRNRLRHILLLAASLLPAAQMNPVRWSMSEQGRKGSVITFKVKADIESGWHLYSISQPPGGPIPTTISLTGEQPFELVGQITGPKPKSEFDRNFEMEVEYYEGVAEFSLPVVQKGQGKQTLRVSAHFQVCNDKLCLPPRTVKLEHAVDSASK